MTELILIAGIFWIFGYKSGIKSEKEMSTFWEKRAQQEAEQNTKIMENFIAF